MADFIEVDFMIERSISAENRSCSNVGCFLTHPVENLLLEICISQFWTAKFNHPDSFNNFFIVKANLIQGLLLFICATKRL